MRGSLLTGSKDRQKECVSILEGLQAKNDPVNEAYAEKWDCGLSKKQAASLSSTFKAVYGPYVQQMAAAQQAAVSGPATGLSLGGGLTYKGVPITTSPNVGPQDIIYFQNGGTVSFTVPYSNAIPLADIRVLKLADRDIAQVFKDGRKALQKLESMMNQCQAKTSLPYEAAYQLTLDCSIPKSLTAYEYFIKLGAVRVA